MFHLIIRLWSHIELRRKKQLFVLFLVMITSSLTEIISIGAVLPFLGALAAPEMIFNHALAQPFLKFLNINKPQDVMLPLTLLFISATIISVLVRALLLWFQTRLSYAIGTDFSVGIYRRTLYQPYQVHLSRNSSQLIAAISSKLNAVISQGIMPLLNILSGTILLTTILIALIAIDPLAALISFVGFGGTYFVVAFFTKKRLNINSQKISLSSNHAIKALQEGLGGIRDILIDGTQKTYCTIYRDAVISMRQAQAGNALIGGAPRLLIESLAISLIASMSYVIAVSGPGFTQAIPILGAFALGAQRLLPMMQQIYQGWSSLKAGRASLSDVLALISQPLPDYLKESKPESIKFENSIRINEIEFSYSTKGPKVLNKINLEIKKGSRIGFVGPTGSGKSTLLDIIMGLLLPTSGTLDVDGTPITIKNYRAWQAHIAHVPQTIFLADVSVAENIAFGIPLAKVNMQRVKLAAKKAQIAETIESWEKKYLTVVGERGVRLSGGQRQRIGIARALYKNVGVLVLDEATNALDSNTEDTVMEAINSIDGNITVLIVTHRPTTLVHCNLIFEISHGQCRELPAGSLG